MYLTQRRRHMPCTGPTHSDYALFFHIYRGMQKALVIASIIGCFLAPAAAQETPLPPQIHPWGQFEPGSWKLVRVVTESFNEKGTVTGTNISDSRTTLLDADDDGVTLEMRVCVEMAGKRFDSEPQTIKQNYFGELQSTALKLKDPAAGQVTIEDRKIPCQIREIESSNTNGKTVTTIYYSTAVPPYILKRESVTTDLEGKNILSETNVSVQALEMPCKISGIMRSAAYVKIVQKTTKGMICTLAFISPDIPGGVVSHSSKELDSSGRLVRRSTLELVDFNANPEKDRSGTFGRKRPARNRGK
jgi:hypothetical protein